MNRRTRHLFTAVLVALVVETLALAEEFSGRIELRLEGAVVQAKDKQYGEPKHLDIYAECSKGEWRDVWGESNEFNRAIHLGQVANARVAPEKLKLKIDPLVTTPS